MKTKIIVNCIGCIILCIAMYIIIVHCGWKVALALYMFEIAWRIDKKYRR